MESKQPGASDAGRVRRLWNAVGFRAILPYLAAAVLLLLAILALGREVEHHLRILEAWVTGLGPWGVLVFVGLLAVGTSLLLPESVFGVAAGALFGLTWGVAASLAGNLLAAALQYALARRLLKGRIERKLAAQPRLAAIQRAVLRDELHLQVLLRLAPLNPATISYLLGAAGVRFWKYLVACLAFAPHLVLEVYLGNAGNHVARIAAGSKPAEVHDTILLGGLAMTILVVVLLSSRAYKAVMAAVAEVEAGGPAPVS